MFHRILRNPDAEASGGGDDVSEEVVDQPMPKAPVAETRADNQHQAHAAQPPAEKIADPAAPGVTLTPEKYEVFLQAQRERDAMLEAEKKRADAARKAEEQRLIEEGKLREVITAKDSEITSKDLKIREIEERSKRTEIERELVVGLAAYTLNEGAPKQLMALLRSELEAVPDGEKWAVQTRDGRDVKTFLSAIFQQSDYHHFLRPGKTGGTDAVRKAQNAPPNPKPVDEEAKIIADFQAAFKKQSEGVPVSLAGRNRLVPTQN